MVLPELQTRRLCVRPWVASADLADFHRIWGDPEVIWWGAMVDADASRDLMERVIDLGPGLGWGAVVLQSTGEIVGNAALTPTPDGRADIEVGWHLARVHWGKGYATEAARALVDHAFTALGLPRVVADIVPGNERSRAVAARLGMQPEETATRAGRVHDVWVRWSDAATHLD